jgi:predicted DCC family thiol-disulfide oxidoreductase YuxK
MSTPTASSAPSARLPRPEDRPEADVVIYDAHCRFCTGQVERIARLDSGGRLAFLSLHDPEVPRRYPDLTHEQLMREMVVIDRRGSRHAGAAGFRYLSRRLRWLWPLAPLLHIPFSMPLWQWCYRQIASRRYLWGKVESCEDGTCRLHAK